MFNGLLCVIQKVNKILTERQKKSIAVLFILMLASALIEAFGISLVIPYFAVLTDPDTFIQGKAGKVIAEFFHMVDTSEILIFLTVILIAAFGAKYLLSYGIRMKQTNFVNQNRFLMAQRVMDSLLREDYESYRYRNLTEEINLVTTHVTWTFELIGAILSMMVQGLNVLLLSIFMLAVDYKVTLIFGTGIVVLYLAFDRLFKKKVALAGAEANRTWEEYDKVISESFLMKKEDDVFQRTDRVFDEFNYYGKRNVKADEKKIRYGMIPGLVTNLVSIWAILFFVLITLMSGNNVTGSIGKLSAFYLAVTRIIPGVNAIYASLHHVSFYRPSLDKVYEELKTVDNSDYGKTLNYNKKVMSRSLRLSDVSIRYRDSEKAVLEHVNFTIQSGERIGIVGKTGSGKTTLINLIIGLLRPVSGRVCIDDTELAEKSILDVGYVPQDTNLLDTTIRENITFGRIVSEEEMIKALQDSGLWGFVSRLPKGTDTLVGAQGIRLSGGQRQRIGIARALIGSPSVLVCDEATASLDLKTEQEIIHTIETLGNKKTVIMISHRPNTLQFCDRWFRVENKGVVELENCP